MIRAHGSTIAPSDSWVKVYGGNRSDLAYSVQQTSDGGFIVAGLTHSFGVGVNLDSQDPWVLRLDASGGIVWQKAYGRAGGVAIAHSVQQTFDGGFIVAGRGTQDGSMKR